MMASKFAKNVNVVSIRIKNEDFLIDMNSVREIYLPGRNIHPIPLADKSIVGYIDIRGNIYTIFSLRHKLYSKEYDYQLTEKSPLLLLNIHNINIALLVDSIIGVKRLPSSVFNVENLIIKTEIDAKFIKSVGEFENETLIMLDIEAVISAEMERAVIFEAKFEKPIEETAQNLTEKISPKKIKSLKLSASQKDTLMEIGNIGTGNAVTALSKVINKRVDVELTDIGIVTSDQLSGQISGLSSHVCGIFAHIEEPSQSTILQVFEMQPMIQVVASLAGKESKLDPKTIKTKDDLDDFAVSTITELGNIMAGHYASSLADLLKMKLVIDIPDFTLAQTSSLGNFLSKEFEKLADYLIIIKTAISVSDLKMHGVFFFIPDIETLNSLFGRLGISDGKVEQDAKPLKPTKLEKPATQAKSEKVAEKPEFKLSPVQRDALQEVGNIGAGHAATALAQMINQRVDIDIPAVQIVELDQYSKEISKANRKLFISWSNVTGKIRSTVLTIFKIQDIISLISLIIDDPSKAKINIKTLQKIADLPELYTGAMSELGHILGSHYTSALGDLLGMKLMTEPPDMNLDTGKKLFKILREDIGIVDDWSIVITTSVIIKEIKVTGSFLYIPELENFQELLDALSEFWA